MSTGAFAERLDKAIQPGDVVTIERPMPGKELHVCVARLVDGYDGLLRGRQEIDMPANPNGVVAAIEVASRKIRTAVEMWEEAQEQD